jgi:hypothetical protein
MLVEIVVEGPMQGPPNRRRRIRLFDPSTSLADRIGRNLQNKLHRRLIEIVLRKCGREIDEAPNQNQQFRRQCFHSARRCDSHDFLSAATPDFLARLLTARLAAVRRAKTTSPISIGTMSKIGRRSACNGSALAREPKLTCLDVF